MIIKFEILDVHKLKSHKMGITCEFSIAQNGEEPITIYLPAKKTRMKFNMKCQTPKKDQTQLAIKHYVRSEYNDFQLIHESMNDGDNDISEIKMVYLMNASFISQITTALNELFPESNISRMIFTNELEDKICCTDIPDAYSPTDNGGIDCFTLG